MRRHSILYTALGLMALLAVLHFIAIAFYFYWVFWWFDIMMHLLAGFAGGLIILWFAKSFSSSKAVLSAIVAVMIVGVVWEIFEYVYDIAAISDYWQDTIIDFMSDMAGAILACLYVVYVSDKHLAVQPPSATMDA